MILYLIRHGKPDYATDSLLPEGVEQAKLCAKRLLVSGVDEIHSSPMGRAQETAQPTAELTGLPIITEEWASELGPESHTRYPDGKDKTISSLAVPLLDMPSFRTVQNEEALHTHPAFNDSSFPMRYGELCEGYDGMLAKLGYERNADGFYEAVSPQKKHVAFFCHCGMMRVLLSHTFHIPYQMLASTLQSQFTGITALYFAADKISTPFPALLSYGDVGHLYEPGKPLIHYFSRAEF